MTRIVINGEEVSKIELGGGVYFEKSALSEEFYAEYTTITNPSFIRLDFNSPVEFKNWVTENKAILKTLKVHRSKGFGNFSDMSRLFLDCASLTNLDLSRFDTSDATVMNAMFFGCKSLTSLDLSNFDTSNNTQLTNMFSRCSALISVNLSSFDTSKTISTAGMFYNCTSLLSIDLSSFDTSKITNISVTMGNMFYSCNLLTSAFARTQADADKFNSSSGKPKDVNFIVKTV